MKKKTFMAGAVLLVLGCTYAISPELAEKARDIPFDQLEQDPDPFKGSLVILGGTIVKTINTTQGSFIEVAQKSLDKWEKPLRTHQSGGMFLVLSARYLDPLLYSAGREITLAGVVEGKQHEVIKDAGSDLPVLRLKELKLWPSEKETRSRPQHLDPLLYDRNASPLQY